MMLRCQVGFACAILLDDRTSTPRPSSALRRQLPSGTRSCKCPSTWREMPCSFMSCSRPWLPGRMWQDSRSLGLLPSTVRPCDGRMASTARCGSRTSSPGAWVLFASAWSPCISGSFGVRQRRRTAGPGRSERGRMSAGSVSVRSGIGIAVRRRLRSEPEGRPKSEPPRWRYAGPKTWSASSSSLCSSGPAARCLLRCLFSLAAPCWSSHSVLRKRPSCRSALC
mmetsp:Transcript_35030/g.100640  ORF Transcript_35030/g.100640 Transcript_35030/m.100640 type:complete len:224 (+) Transcript_35030:510-1181(+)